MRIPYVIDNIEHKLAEVLNTLLGQQDGQRLDVATAYFSVRGFRYMIQGCRKCSRGFHTARVADGRAMECAATVFCACDV